MKTFKEIEARYRQMVDAAYKFVTEESVMVGKYVHDGVTYTVKWGADVDGYDQVVGVMVVLTDAEDKPIPYLNVPLALRDTIVALGYMRLGSWANDGAPFPETTEALFAPI